MRLLRVALAGGCAVGALVACNALSGISEYEIVACVRDCGTDDAGDEGGPRDAGLDADARVVAPVDADARRAFARWPATGDAGAIVGEGIVTDRRTHLTWSETASGGIDTEAKAEAYCAGLTTAGGGFTLPTRIELASLIDPGTWSPAAPPWANAAFDGPYWTASSRRPGSGQYWSVDFLYGDLRPDAVARHVRCVRLPDPAIYPTGAHYELFDRGSAVIVDRYTKLGWQRGQALGLSWNDAQQACGSLRIGGEGGFRLPEIGELLTLVDDVGSPSWVTPHRAIDWDAFYDTSGTAPFWSATRVFGQTKAWVVAFDTGQTSSRDVGGEIANVRCVR